MRDTTWHSMTALADASVGAPVSAPGTVCSDARRSSPGAKARASARITARSSASGTIDTAKRAPATSSGSIARSFLTAMVRPGGLKLACETQDASIADVESSSFADTTAREPTTRPIASVGDEASVRVVSPADTLASRALSCRLMPSASSRPDSSHVCRSFAVGRNLTRIGLNEKPNPASRSFCSISSTASPLQPKLPNTPHGMRLASDCRMTAPSATCTCVGMWPPSVGLPMTKPLLRLIASTTASMPSVSRLSISTATPALVMPRLMACARAVVLPYAEA
mmetsp:Transcript_39268/g.116818  ORF Transcript_39268/g.116818 Transcript_39268/m.116818 type:complete len:282 (-) Transcript_39268:1375-2220(-)